MRTLSLPRSVESAEADALRGKRGLLGLVLNRECASLNTSNCLNLRSIHWPGEVLSIERHEGITFFATLRVSRDVVTLSRRPEYAFFGLHTVSVEEGGRLERIGARCF